MAAVRVRHDQVVLRLNLIERLLTLSVRSPRLPLDQVETVLVNRRPGRLLQEVDFGFSGNSSPLGWVLKAFTRASYQGARASCLVYMRCPAVQVLFKSGATSRLWLASSTDAQRQVDELRQALHSSDGDG